MPPRKPKAGGSARDERVSAQGDLFSATARVEAVSTVALPPLPPHAPRLPAFMEPDRLNPLTTEAGATVRARDEKATVVRHLLAAAASKRQPRHRREAFQGDVLAEALEAGRLSVRGDSSVGALRVLFTPASLDDLAIAIYGAWRNAGYPMEHKDVLTAAAAIGGDRFALELGDDLRSWHSKYNVRAAFALGVLDVLGGPMADYQIVLTSTEVALVATPALAYDLVVKRAAQAGMTVDDYTNHAVPKLGLDHDEAWSFGVSGHRFTLSLDSRLRPSLRHEGGASATSLPPSGTGATDSPDHRRWSNLQVALAAVARHETARLERAMVHRTRWTRENWVAEVAPHPLLGILGRGVLWGAYDSASRLTMTFVLTDARTPAAVDGSPVELTDPSVGIVHPVRLSAAERTAWSAWFAREGREQPFEQTERRVLTVTPEEAVHASLHWWCRQTVEATDLVGLRRLGWELTNNYGSSALVTAIYRSLGGGRLLELLLTPGFEFQHAAAAPDQTIVGVRFVRPGRSPKGRRVLLRVPLRMVNEVPLSEALRDLAVALGPPTRCCPGPEAHRASSAPPPPEEAGAKVESDDSEPEIVRDESASVWLLPDDEKDAAD
ncbi:MAG TPA: DUF4132 domain-containing protein [Polyangia bacterium]|jgi:hypothetical protein